MYLYSPDVQLVIHNSSFFEIKIEENPFGNLFLELLWLYLKFSNLNCSTLKIEIPVLREIHTSLTLFLNSISRLLIFPLNIELKPDKEL